MLTREEAQGTEKESGKIQTELTSYSKVSSSKLQYFTTGISMVLLRKGLVLFLGTRSNKKALGAGVRPTIPTPVATALCLSLVLRVLDNDL